MNANCCQHDHEPDGIKSNQGRYRKILWVALVINFTMFLVEIASGVKANSVSLFADSLDFLGDSAN